MPKLSFELRRPLAQRLLAAACAVIVAAASSVSMAITVDTVPIGNPGNPTDIQYTSSGPFGRVDYAYRMGTYEVTNDQYAAFLNSIAASDFNGLYHTLMESDQRGGIIRNGASGAFSYEVKPNMGNKPVIAINLWDAARFTNWLNNGQPAGAQTAETTEDGAYALNGLAPVDNPTWTRKPTAVWFLPTENEWYKAAFYDPRATSAGGPSNNDHYWLYASKGDTPPTIATANTQGDISNPGPNVANYAGGGGWNSLTANLTSVGSAGPLSASYYGTYDQGGNIHELLETPLPPQHYVSRGGTYGSVASLISAAARTGNYASVDQPSSGFRVAKIAEVSTNTPGDYDHDGAVGATDYAIWRSTLGTVVTPGQGADGNANGTIDAADYVVWRSYLSAGSAAAVSTSVPEPMSFCIAFITIVATFGSARSRRSSGLALVEDNKEIP